MITLCLTFELGGSVKSHRIHEGALHAVEDDDADGQKYHHEGEAVAQQAPAELSLAEEAVFEGLDNTRQGVEAHHEAQLLVGDGAQWVDDRRGIHPQADEEVEQQRHVAVFGGEAREEDAEAQGQSCQHQHQHGQQQGIPVGVYLSGDDEQLVDGVDHQEESELDAEAQQVADDGRDGYHHAWEVDLAEDAGVGGEGRRRLGEAVVEVLPEADAAEVEQRLR